MRKFSSKFIKLTKIILMSTLLFFVSGISGQKNDKLKIGNIIKKAQADVVGGGPSGTGGGASDGFSGNQGGNSGFGDSTSGIGGTLDLDGMGTDASGRV